MHLLPMALVCLIGPVRWDEFEKTFRLAMGTEMIPQKRNWFRLSNLALAADEDVGQKTGDTPPSASKPSRQGPPDAWS